MIERGGETLQQHLQFNPNTGLLQIGGRPGGLFGMVRHVYAHAEDKRLDTAIGSRGHDLGQDS
jgi:hypothetical protein